LFGLALFSGFGRMHKKRLGLGPVIRDGAEGNLPGNLSGKIPLQGLMAET
jgi:hypothetical protein